MYNHVNKFTNKISTLVIPFTKNIQQFRGYYVNNERETKIANKLNNIEWHDSLKSIIFNHNFNQKIDKVKFSDSLETIIFGSQFNQPLYNINWPNSLQSLTFGYDFNQPLI